MVKAICRQMMISITFLVLLTSAALAGNLCFIVKIGDGTRNKAVTNVKLTFIDANTGREIGTNSTGSRSCFDLETLDLRQATKLIVNWYDPDSGRRGNTTEFFRPGDTTGTIIEIYGRY